MYLTPICLGDNRNFNQILHNSSQSTQFQVYYKGMKDPLSAKLPVSLLDISVSQQNRFVCIVESHTQSVVITVTDIGDWRYWRFFFFLMLF